MPIDITLAKLKYRNPNSRIRPALQGEPAGMITRVYMAGTFKSKNNISGTAQKARQGTGHRRRQGLGATGLA